MSRAKIINYKGKSIFYMDFSNIKTREEVIKIIEDSKSYIHSQPEASVNGLTNLDNIFFNTDVKNDFLLFIKANKKFMKNSALFGMSGLVRIMFNGLMRITGRDIRSFENMIDAQEFLAKNN